jgi:MoxR-like ATPase
MVKYPSGNEEFEILKRWTGAVEPDLEAVITREELLEYQKLVRQVPIADHVVHYASRLARATRPGESEAPEFVGKWVSWGAGPRAGLNMILAGKARAVLRGRAHVSVDDIQAVARPVLRHRLILNFAAQSEGVGIEDVITRLLETVPSDEKVYHGSAEPVQAATS